jgi:hypothetical protein
MTPFAKQFDNAQHDPEWRSRFIQDECFEEDDGDDDFVTHMRFECRQGKFV